MARINTEVQTPAPVPALIEQKFEQLTSDSNELIELTKERLSNARAVALKLGYDGPIDIESLWRGVRDATRQMNQASIEFGSYLILIKEQHSHGEFYEQLAAREIHPRVANKYMTVALRFADSKMSAHVKALGITKLLEMVALGDDEIEDLMTDGTLRGHKVGPVDRMSVRELKQKIADMEADKIATERLIVEKDGKLNELTRQVKKFNIHKDIPDAFVPLHALTGALRSEAVKKVQALVQCGRDAISQEPASEEEKQVYEEQFAALSTTIFDSLEAIRLELERAFKQFDESIGVHMPLPSAE